MRTSSQRLDETVDRLLREGRRIPTRAASDPVLLQLLDHSIAQARARQRSRRRWALAPAAVVAALLGGLTVTGALPALADSLHRFAAQTGIFGDGGGVDGGPSGKHYSEMDDSEWIDLSSPDFGRYAVRLLPAYVTLPDTVDRSRFARDVAEGLAEHDSARGAVMQVSGIRRRFEVDAGCVWYQTWHDAARDGDTARAAEAGRQWDAAASWPQTVATDGGGVVVSLHRVAVLARAGDWVGARRELGVDCTPADVAAVTR